MTTPDERPALLAWMRENLEKGISKDMLYRDAAIQQMCFFRDRVAPLFYRPEMPYEEREAFCKIAGWHRSKSIHLPVYGIRTPRVDIVARDNFYNWNVTVVSQVSLELPGYFNIDDLNGYLFLEGMENHKRGRFADSHTEFSFAVGSDHRLFAILWCIAAQVQQ